MKRHCPLDALCRLKCDKRQPRLPAMSTISCRAKLVASVAFTVIASAFGLPGTRAQAPPIWPPVPPEELALKDNPFALCALDQAAHDLWGKLNNAPVWKLWGLSTEKIPASDYTKVRDFFELVAGAHNAPVVLVKE